MMDPKLTEWCKSATAKIRFSPDRDAVYEELLQHMEDKYCALLKSEVPEPKIPEQILHSMGSAEEIAPQLAAIHRPFWGYLERITRYIAYTLTVLLCTALLVFFFNYGPNLIEDLLAPESTAEGTALDVDTAAWSDGYLLRVDKITAFQEGPEGAALSFAALEVDIYSALPSEIGLAAIFDFWAEDDLGNYYYSSNDATYKDDQRISYASHRFGLLHSRIELIVWGFDPDAKWLRLCYDRDGREIVLHIDLTGGAEG